jgi:ribosomal-protein-alanine N-acetyltransferase
MGFVGLWFGEDEAHITAIAVREGWRRRGIGELLMIAAFEMTRMRRCNYMSLEVRMSNKVAQSLYSKYGFKEVGVRRGYYNDNHEDALIMTTSRIDGLAYREEVTRLVEAFKAKKGDFALTFA